MSGARSNGNTRNRTVLKSPSQYSMIVRYFDCDLSSNEITRPCSQPNTCLPILPHKHKNQPGLHLLQGGALSVSRYSKQSLIWSISTTALTAYLGVFDWLNFITGLVSPNKVLLQSSRQAKYGLQMKLELFFNSKESLSGAWTTNFLFWRNLLGNI